MTLPDQIESTGTEGLPQQSFYARLLAETTPAREAFLNIPIIVTALNSGVPRAQYLDYLAQAYHHVRHTCPLLAAALARCTKQDAVYREALLEYIEEERGHEQWILNDIAALGGDAESVRAGEGNDAVRVMVAYAYHVIERVSPYALLGMVHVLEGMSVALAQQAAASIGQSFAADGGKGFSYLTSHGCLDQEHVAFFEQLVNAIDDPVHERAIIDTARIMYRLFSEIFNTLDAPGEESRNAA
jgi:pyrroloquinoline quinone (PQQ) biosynthesis protein C